MLRLKCVRMGPLACLSPFAILRVDKGHLLRSRVSKLPCYPSLIPNNSLTHFSIEYWETGDKNGQKHEYFGSTRLVINTIVQNIGIQLKVESNISPLFNLEYWPNMEYFLNNEARWSYSPKFGVLALKNNVIVFQFSILFSFFAKWGPAKSSPNYGAKYGGIEGQDIAEIHWMRAMCSWFRFGNNFLIEPNSRLEFWHLNWDCGQGNTWNFEGPDATAGQYWESALTGTPTLSWDIYQLLKSFCCFPEFTSLFYWNWNLIKLVKLCCNAKY